jgi:hypothetical protein
MKKLKHPEYIDDIMRVQAVLRVNGYDATFSESEDLLEKYSDSLCARWLFLPKDDYLIWEFIKEFIEEE